MNNLEDRTQEKEAANAWWGFGDEQTQKHYLSIYFGSSDDQTASLFVTGGKVGGPSTAPKAGRRVSIDRNNLVRLNLKAYTPNCNYDLELDFKEQEMTQAERDVIIDEIMRDRI